MRGQPEAAAYRPGDQQPPPALIADTDTDADTDTAETHTDADTDTGSRLPGHIIPC